MGWSFLHFSLHPRTSMSTKKACCHFLRGACSYGNSCSFPHDAAATECRVRDCRFHPSPHSPSVASSYKRKYEDSYTYPYAYGAQSYFPPPTHYSKDAHRHTSSFNYQTNANKKQQTEQPQQSSVAPKKLQPLVCIHAYTPRHTYMH